MKTATTKAPAAAGRAHPLQRLPQGSEVGFRPTGQPVGGFYATDAQGRLLVHMHYAYGDMPPRFPTPQAAMEAGPRMFLQPQGDASAKPSTQKEVVLERFGSPGRARAALAGYLSMFPKGTFWVGLRDGALGPQWCVVQGGTPDVAVRFEAVGFVATRRRMQALEANEGDVQALWPRVKAACAAHGFTAVQEASLEEDEGQENTEIKVFVCVTLQGHSQLSETSDVPHDLCAALDDLAQAVCCSKSSGEDWVGAENWEVAEVEHGECAEVQCIPSSTATPARQRS